MTAKQFRKLLAVYGGDLARWPEAVRTEAQSLAHTSPDARASLLAARELDAAIAAAAARGDARLWQAGELEAAAWRVCGAVSARTARSGSRDRPPASAPRYPLSRRRWLGLAMLGMLAVATGVLIGMQYESPSSSANLLNWVQPTPVYVLTE